MTSRKNILIFMHNDGTQFIDIANQYAKSFDKNNFKVTVVYLSKNQQIVLTKTEAEEVIYLNCSKRDIRGLKIGAIKQMVALCRARKFSVVICHRYKPIYIMLWAAQFCRIPMLIFVMHALHTITHIGRKILIAGLIRKNMYFAGVSNSVRDDLRKNLWRVPAERIITLYNSIDVNVTEATLLTRADAREYLKLSPDTFVFGTVGRLVPDKDQRTLIRAFKIIHEKIPQAKLMIIGDGRLAQDLKNLVDELDLHHAVIFTGFIANASCYLKAFDVFVLSSVEEAFGLVLIEAMVARLPVIGTRVYGIPEVISDAGLLVEPGNAELLAQAMLTMALSDERLNWGEKAYAQVNENFSLERFKEKLSAVINQLR